MYRWLDGENYPYDGAIGDAGDPVYVSVLNRQ